MWQRNFDDMPDDIRLTVVISSRKHPELARWVWGLPYRKASSIIRDILAEAAKGAAANAANPQTAPPEASPPRPGPRQNATAQETKDSAAISADVARIMNNFKDMF